MAYNSAGRRPFERASRSSHHHIINDGDVQALLEASWIPEAAEVSESEWELGSPKQGALAGVEHVIAVDGSFTETVVQPKYPSSAVGFMQFGALSFKRSDLEHVDRSPHPAPEDMERLRNLERLKLAYPIRGVRLKDCQSLFATAFGRRFTSFSARPRLRVYPYPIRCRGWCSTLSCTGRSTASLAPCHGPVC